MKKTLAFLLGLGFLLPFAAFAACSPVALGGTGNCTITVADVLFGNGTSPIATSSVFTFTTASSRLNVTTASTTNLSASSAFYLPALATAAGSLLAIDFKGQVIATSTSSGVTSVTATWPVLSSGGTTPVISWGGLATSSGLTSGRVHYSTGVNTFADIATSTPTVTSPITYSGTLGNFVGGVSGAFACATCNTSSLSGSGTAGMITSWLTSTALTATSTPTATAYTATSSTATSTFQGDVWIQGLSDLPNAYLLVGTTSPNAGRLAGDLIDQVWNGNGLSSINSWNAGTGSCAQSGFIADGNNPIATGYFGSFMFQNDGWTGSGCTLGTQTGIKPESLALFNPTGEMDFEIASTTTGVNFNWLIGGGASTNIKMTLANNGKLGIGTTTPGNTLSVEGSSLLGNSANAGYFIGTTTTSNVFPNASTTALSVNNDTVTGKRYLTFTYATTTAWTGTTTLLQLGVAPIGLTFSSVQCGTDAGTLNLQYQYGTGPTLVLPMILGASSTVGTVNFTSNNTPVSPNIIGVKAGTPASSPTTVTCTVTAKQT